MCSDDDDYVESNPYEDQMMETADRMWKDYQTNYIPLENQMMDRIAGYDSDAYKQYSKDRAVTSARMQTPGTVTAGAGMDPSGGNFVAASAGAQQQAGMAGGLGAMSGLQTAEDQYLGGSMNLAQVGRNQQATSMAGMGNMASLQAGQDAAALAANQSVQSAKWGAAGSVAGLGMAYHGHTKGWWGDKNTSSGTK